MTHKNIFLSLFVLANMGLLFSMESGNKTLVKRLVRPMTPMDKLYPADLNMKDRVKKRKQAMREAQSKNNTGQKDKENNTVNNAKQTINNQTQKNKTSI